MAIVNFRGRVSATPSALTALVNGVEVFSGQVGPGVSLDTEINLFAVNTAGGAVSISVTSGVVTVGGAHESISTAWDATKVYQDGTSVENAQSYYLAKNSPPMGTAVTDVNYWDAISYDDTFGPDDRTAILINGSAPEWPATPVVPMPGGTEENPDWTNWFFELGAGETMTMNVIIQPPPPVPPTS